MPCLGFNDTKFNEFIYILAEKMNDSNLAGQTIVIKCKR